ncbi:MAG: hypothetical protein H6822_23055 [Planctomycetaceae bacterium]|nr:hypothetical protein [Planctomycetales bacterium]MCB9925076.1 hypothetical protein [Planctomycetaceae bacterium]
MLYQLQILSVSPDAADFWWGFRVVLGYLTGHSSWLMLGLSANSFTSLAWSNVFIVR